MSSFHGFGKVYTIFIPTLCFLHQRHQYFDGSFCSPTNTSFPVRGGNSITALEYPALQPDQIPPIDAVLLSHEDHPDNLDSIGRTHFLDGRKALTTSDGANALNPHSSVIGLQPWQATQLNVKGETWNTTGTACEHLPGGQVVGFFHIRAAVFNMGDAHAIVNGTTIKITIDGLNVARLFKAVGADILVPMHFNPWSRFKESVSQLKKDLEAEGVANQT
ncbi:hypothetical protein EDB80DRAFT_751850 [Ilyonectria destructans]|nr:hypothetical protein EDB80DRAFT_751850 [Ilyonectria destructans]